MKIGKAEAWLKQELQKIYEEGEAAQLVSMVLEHLTGLNRAERMKHKEEELQKEKANELLAIHERLMANEPVQYILRHCWFYDMKLYVEPPVLIPRPETAELVDWIIRDVKKKGVDVFGKDAGEADETKRLKILDVGTGSGCIALALKKAMPRAEVWGCDQSELALNIARRNASELNIRVDFQGMDFLDANQQKLLPSVDIIVSNPPYIPVSEKNTLAANVLNYEPHTALFAPASDPLGFYRSLIDFSKNRLYDGGMIYMEIHEHFGKEVNALFEKEGFEVELRKDMQGKDRMVRARHLLKL